MKKNTLIFVPGLSNKFSSDLFESAKKWGIKNNFKILKIKFKKYALDKKSDITFNEQKKELKELVKKNKNIIFISKSLGCIPTLLIDPKYPKILFSPTISISNEDSQIFDTKFKNLISQPVKIDKKRISNKFDIIIFGSEDNKIDINSIKNSNINFKEIINQGHRLYGKELENFIEDSLNEIKKNYFA